MAGPAVSSLHPGSRRGGTRAKVVRVWGRVASVLMLASPMGAQQLAQIEAGGNSITGAYGGAVRFWTPTYEGWLAAGYAGGTRLAGFVKVPVHRDTLRFGYDVYPLTLPTDVWLGPPYLVTQGAGWRRTAGPFKIDLFGGVAGIGAAAPFVNTSRSERPLGAVRVESQPLANVTASTQAVIARRQSFLEGLTWRPSPALGHLAGSAGVGSNRPFEALSWKWEGDVVDVLGGYTWLSRGFRRADAPLPSLTEAERENVALAVRPFRTLQIDLGHRNLVDIQDTMPSTRLTLDQVALHTSLLGWRASTGVFESRSTKAGRNRSGYVGFGRDLFDGLVGSDFTWLQATDRASGTTTRLVTAQFHEDVHYDLNLSQYLSYQGGSLSVGLGGGVRYGLSSVLVDYQTVYVPTSHPNPFVRTLLVGVTLQLGDYSAKISTNVESDGRVTYAASGSTFLYLGEPAWGLGGQPVTLRMQRYVARGVVVTEDGRPVEGAAIRIDGNTVITDSHGAFFVRSSRRKAMPVQVVFDEFLAFGTYELVSAPENVAPESEAQATPIRIVLRRTKAPPDKYR